jgi:hypothetical protein
MKISSAPPAKFFSLPRLNSDRNIIPIERRPAVLEPLRITIIQRPPCKWESTFTFADCGCARKGSLSYQVPSGLRRGGPPLILCKVFQKLDLGWDHICLRSRLTRKPQAHWSGTFLSGFYFSGSRGTNRHSGSYSVVGDSGDLGLTGLFAAQTELLSEVWLWEWQSQMIIPLPLWMAAVQFSRSRGLG